MKEYKKKSDRYKRYLILCLYTALVFAGYYMALWLDPSHGMHFGHDFLYLFCAFPVLAAVGGILSYKLTERLIVPAALQLAVGYVLCPLLLLYLYTQGLDFGEGVTHIFLLAPIATVISAIFSCLTKLVIHLLHKLKKSHT